MPSTENEGGVCLTGWGGNLNLRVLQRKERSVAGIPPRFPGTEVVFIFITFVCNLNIFLEQIKIYPSGFHISVDTLMGINVPHLVNATSPAHSNAGSVGSAAQPRNVRFTSPADPSPLALMR